ncbi:MAG: DUF1003 domain-containing protein [Ktedonobacterales bacterium]
MAAKAATAETVSPEVAEKRPVGSSRHYIHVPHSVGERLADTIASTMGSWTFIIWQSVIVGIWIILNLVAISLRWDPYPFILLNLLFSTQAAYAAPIIMMSQNRAAQKDHIRDDHEADEVDILYKINQQQLEILSLLRQQLCTPDATTPPTSASEAPDTPAKPSNVSGTTPQRKH